MRCVLLVVLGALATAGAAEVRRLPRGFGIATPRLSATVVDGVIVELVDLTTGERHAEAATDELDLPRGLGTMAGNVAGMRSLHSPWGHHPPGTAYPTQRRPAAEARFETADIPGGIRATWSGLTNGLASHPDDSLSVDATVDDAGRLLLRAAGRSADRGVYGVLLPLANLHADHRFLVASFGGVMYDATSDPGLITLGGTPFWEAPVVAVEGRRGSLGLWVEDADFKPTFFFLNWTGRSFGTAVESLNWMPYEPHDAVESVTWRLDAFPGGGWVDALQPYRDWYATTFAPELAARAAVSWADRIRVVVDHLEPTDQAYRELAATVDPETVLIHEWNARAPAFDTELPDWTPRAGYVDRVRLAQRYGFRTMAYVNTFCANYQSPVWLRDKLDEFALLRVRGSLWDYRETPLTLTELTPGQILYLDPLSAAWRRYHTEMMITWRQETGTDANYEDVGGTGGDFGNGTVDGLTGAQGAREQFRELLQRNPEVPMAAEYAPDNIAFAVRWPLRYQQVWGSEATRVWWMEHQRPISAYLHGPGQIPWIPVINATSDFGRHVVCACSDALGGMAQLAATTGELTAVSGMPYHMRRRAQLFAGRQLVADFPTGRWPDTLACVYRDRDGRRYDYHAGPTAQRLVGPDGLPLYERVTGLNEWATPLTVPGWPAAGDGRVFGLDPAARYALSPGRHDRTKIRLTALPAGIRVRRFEANAARAVLALEPIDPATAPAAGEIALRTTFRPLAMLINDRPVGPPAWDEAAGESAESTYTVSFPASIVAVAAPPATVVPGRPLGEDRQPGRYITVSSGLERGGEYHARHYANWPTPGEETAPSYAFVNGGGEAEIALDYLITVPSATAVLRIFLRQNQERYGNGAIARVYLNGREAHALDLGPRANPAWAEGDDPATRQLWDTDVHAWYLPIGHLAGQPLAITIASDAKGDDNADQLWWARPVILEDPAQEARFVRLTAGGAVAE